MQIRSISVLASSRQRYLLRRPSLLPFGKAQKVQDYITKTIRDPVHNSIHAHAAWQIAYVVATFHHIDA